MAPLSLGFLGATCVTVGRCVSAKGAAGGVRWGTVAVELEAVAAGFGETTLEPWVMPLRYSAKAVANANMVGKRFSGFFAIALRQISSSLGGTPGRISLGFRGSLVRICTSMLAVLPLKGRVPHSNSYMIVPSA
jgi:hypothetical protein